MVASPSRAFACSALGPHACLSASTSMRSAAPEVTWMLPAIFDSINVAPLPTGKLRVSGSVDSTRAVLGVSAGLLVGTALVAAYFAATNL